jgi:hypothetical protein
MAYPHLTFRIDGSYLFTSTVSDKISELSPNSFPELFERRRCPTNDEGDFLFLAYRISGGSTPPKAITGSSDTVTLSPVEPMTRPTFVLMTIQSYGAWVGHD